MPHTMRSILAPVGWPFQARRPITADEVAIIEPVVRHLREHRLYSTKTMVASAYAAHTVWRAPISEWNRRCNRHEA
jgi:hypothetical protein